MKKLISLFIAAGMLMAALTGCSEKPAENTTTSSKDDTSNVSTTEPVANSDNPLLLSNEKATLSVFASTKDSSDLSGNEFTKWLEEKTNVQIKWEIASDADAKQKLSLLMTSDDYTDILFQPGWGRSELLLYANQGVVIKLNDLIDKNAPNLKKMWEEYPTYKNELTLNDGNIYCMGKASDCYHCKVTGKMWVYQPWLEKLNLKAPTTTAEYKDMLIAFRDNDPNGNGKKDEVALSGSPTGWDANPINFLMNAFVYYGSSQNYTVVNNGKVEPVFTTDAYKNGLKYINDLYKEGLIAPETFTQDEKQLGTLGSTQPQILGASAGGWHGSFSVLTDGVEGEWTKWETIAPLTGPDGAHNTAYYPADNYNGSQGVITDKCKNPELAVRWLDLFYDNEMAMNAYYGVLGEGWEYVTDAAVVGSDGNPAKWKILPKGAQTDVKIGWGNTGSMANLPGWHSSQAIENAEINLEGLLYKNSIPYYDAIPKQDSIIPVGLMYDENDAKIMAEFDATVFGKGYLEEMNTRFVTGDADIDKGWDGYLKELDQMGLKEYIAIIQKAYDQKLSSQN